MVDKVFFDTNILLYTIGQHDARTPVAETLLAHGGVISVQVLNELASVAHRKLQMPWSEVAEALDAIRILCPSPLPITAEMHEEALRLASQHGFHIYDALIVAAALEAGCATLYTEDLHSGQVIDGRLTIRNPFKGVAELGRRAAPSGI
jgi:predicted nucleic acid-binding protein